VPNPLATAERARDFWFRKPSLSNPLREEVLKGLDLSSVFFNLAAAASPGWRYAKRTARRPVRLPDVRAGGVRDLPARDAVGVLNENH
jgi:hypothetical protein